jgi:hypothetical protein
VDLSARVPLVRSRGPSRAESISWSFVMSTCVHAAIALALMLRPALPMSRGEDGSEGAGGVTFEVSVQGPQADAPVPVLPSAEPAAPTPERTSGSRGRPTTRILPTTNEGTEAIAATAPVEGHDDEGATLAPAPAGTGADQTSSGRSAGPDDARLRALLSGSVGGGVLGGSSLGDVALLTEASRCPDPVAGTWTAHRYSPEFRDWARFTLSITRVGDRLTGTIRTRMWRGLASDIRPPVCAPGGWDYTVEMNAHGSVSGDHFDFGAREHHIAHVECASPLFGYNPDHFSGTFDVERDELLTVNNDGGRDIDAAYTFRRSSCQP